jgi:hypothetical protein
MELDTRMPASGGEYVFNYDICGPMQGFLAFWIAFAVMVPASCGAVGQTAGVYLAALFELDDNKPLCILIADIFMSKAPYNFIYVSIVLMMKPPSSSVLPIRRWAPCSNDTPRV